MQKYVFSLFSSFFKLLVHKPCASYIYHDAEKCSMRGARCRTRTTTRARQGLFFFSVQSVSCRKLLSERKRRKFWNVSDCRKRLVKRSPIIAIVLVFGHCFKLVKRLLQIVFHVFRILCACVFGKQIQRIRNVNRMIHNIFPFLPV